MKKLKIVQTVQDTSMLESRWKTRLCMMTLEYGKAHNLLKSEQHGFVCAKRNILIKEETLQDLLSFNMPTMFSEILRHVLSTTSNSEMQEDNCRRGIASGNPPCDVREDECLRSLRLESQLGFLTFIDPPDYVVYFGYGEMVTVLNMAEKLFDPESELSTTSPTEPFLKYLKTL